jgi:hypothetical protein
LSETHCVHQCRRCGVVYGCGEEKCSQPFDSGYCNVCSPATVEPMNYLSLAG